MILQDNQHIYNINEVIPMLLHGPVGLSHARRPRFLAFSFSFSQFHFLLPLPFFFQSVTVICHVQHLHFFVWLKDFCLWQVRHHRSGLSAYSPFICLHAVIIELELQFKVKRRVASGEHALSDKIWINMYPSAARATR